MRVTSNASWDRSYGRAPQSKDQVGYVPPDIRPGDLLLVTSGGDHWRPDQTCSFGDPLQATSGGGN